MRSLYERPASLFKQVMYSQFVNAPLLHNAIASPKSSPGIRLGKLQVDNSVANSSLSWKISILVQNVNLHGIS